MCTIRFLSSSTTVLAVALAVSSIGSVGSVRAAQGVLELASGEARQEQASDPESEPVASRRRIEVEEPKSLPHEKPEFLGTTTYKPTELEAPFLSKFKPEDLLPGSTSKADELRGRVGQQVTWFGIVREDKWIRARGEREEHHELLIEHKYFDGLTDLHQQIVSFAGGGDFKAVLPFEGRKLPFKTLTLVRCYGEVISEKKGVPTVNVDFIRVWPWNNFAFMDLANEATPDLTNKRWRKRIKIPDRVYSAVPDTNYYKKLLGKRKK